MYKYCILILCLFSISTEAGLVSRRVSNPFGIVEGIENCGSEGQIIQVRVTNCERVPCDVLVGLTYTVEIDFIPKYTHEILHLKVVLAHQGASHTVVDQDVPNSGVVAGRQYTFTYQMPISDQFIGFSELWVGILGGDVLELCGIAGLNVSRP